MSLRPRVKEKEGALLNHMVAGPQCQENAQRLYEKYVRSSLTFISQRKLALTTINKLFAL
jgi:hypothetical protein